MSAVFVFVVFGFMCIPLVIGAFASPFITDWLWKRDIERYRREHPSEDDWEFSGLGVTWDDFCAHRDPWKDYK